MKASSAVALVAMFVLASVECVACGSASPVPAARPEAAPDPARVEAARALLEEAMTVHERGQSQDASELARATLLYTHYLEDYPGAERVDDAFFYRAEIAHHHDDRHIDAGLDYLRAVSSGLREELVEDALYNAVGALTRVRERREPGRMAAMRDPPRATGEWVCEQCPADAPDPRFERAVAMFLERAQGSSDLPEVLFLALRARLAHDRLEDATTAFERLLAYPASPVLVAALELLLPAMAARDRSAAEALANRLSEHEALRGEYARAALEPYLRTAVR